MGLSVWRETSKKLTVYRVCYTPIETLVFLDFSTQALSCTNLQILTPERYDEHPRWVRGWWSKTPRRGEGRWILSPRYVKAVCLTRGNDVGGRKGKGGRRAEGAQWSKTDTRMLRDKINLVLTSKTCFTMCSQKHYWALTAILSIILFHATWKSATTIKIFRTFYDTRLTYWARKSKK